MLMTTLMEVKVTLREINLFKVCGSGAFSACTALSDRPAGSWLENAVTCPEGNLAPTKQSRPLPSPGPPATAHLLPAHLLPASAGVPALRVPYKWNHTLRDLRRLASSRKHGMFPRLPTAERVRRLPPFRAEACSSAQADRTCPRAVVRLAGISASPASPGAAQGPGGPQQMLVPAVVFHPTGKMSTCSPCRTGRTQTTPTERGKAHRRPGVLQQFRSLSSICPVLCIFHLSSAAPHAPTLNGLGSPSTSTSRHRLPLALPLPQLPIRASHHTRLPHPHAPPRESLGSGGGARGSLQVTAAPAATPGLRPSLPRPLRPRWTLSTSPPSESCLCLPRPCFPSGPVLSSPLRFGCTALGQGL